MEALQMLKCYLKKEHLSFTENCVMPEKHLVEDAQDKDILNKLLQDHPWDGLSYIIQSINNYED